MSNTLHMQQMGARDGFSHRSHLIIEAIELEADSGVTQEDQLQGILDVMPVELDPVPTHYVVDLRDNAPEVANLLAEEDEHFSLLQAMAAGEDGLIDLTDEETSMVSSVAPEISSPVFLGEEDLAVNHFHRDRSVPADMEKSFGFGRSLGKLFELSGVQQVDFDGFSSNQSDQAILARDRLS